MYEWFFSMELMGAELWLCGQRNYGGYQKAIKVQIRVLGSCILHVFSHYPKCSIHLLGFW